MAEAHHQMSAAALRMAGHVGQTALDRIADGGPAAVAELDQHVAAVRAELAVCQQPPGGITQPARSRTSSMRTGLDRLRRRIRVDQKVRGSRTDFSSDLQARLGVLRSETVTCPDVPFVSDALRAEDVVPVALLLHYASGFVQAGISDGWRPGKSADATDWVSLRLAAICKLISQAEAAADMHPDLRTTA